MRVLMVPLHHSQISLQGTSQGILPGNVQCVFLQHSKLFLHSTATQ